MASALLGSPVRAAPVNPCARTVVASLADAQFADDLAEFQGWKTAHPGPRKTELIARTNLLVRKAASSFRAHGIRFETRVSRAGADRLVILPGDDSPYNRYARGIRKFGAHFETIYDPYALYRSQTPAYFLSSDGVYISSESVELRSPKEESIRHETVHAFVDHLERTGQLSELHSWLKPRPGFSLPGPRRGYSSFVSVDELWTYQLTLRDTSRDYAEAMESGADPARVKKLRKDYLDSVRDFRTIQLRIRESASIIAEALSTLEKSGGELRFNRERPVRRQFTLDGKIYRAEFRARSYENGEFDATAFQEVGEISITQLGAPRKGERPLGFDLWMPLRSAERGTATRDALAEVKARLAATQELEGHARAYLEAITGAMPANSGEKPRD